MNNDLSASEAARILGVSVATLYSYVSRGLLTPTSTQASRSKRYPHEAVLRLAARKADAKRGGHMATAAMNWGVPVLETRISRIADGRLYYRADDALALADAATLEMTACILWDDARHDYFAEAFSSLPEGLLERARALAQGMAPLERAVALMPVLAQALPAQTAHACGMLQSGPALMRLLAAVLLEVEPSALPLHQQVALAWGADANQCELIRAAMVLLADHELNASTFTVRCVASTGAGLAATLSAGLAALSGPRHGGGSSAAKVMLVAALAAPSAMEYVAACHAAQDDSLEGYGHPLYPAGDPRAAYLLERLARLSAGVPKVAAILAICTEAGGRQGMLPNADLALAALELACGWPDSAGLILFALARSAGWIAHAAEQAGTGAMIRPRARYVGRYQTA
ncbi:citrate synthase [Oxalobacteraceae bacterium GrIS 1.11]